MDQAALRPYAAVGVALLGASLIATVATVAPKPSNPHVQSPAVELTSGADAFLDLANALDPSAASDGLIGIANNLDSFVDLFGNPTVNVADTLATDVIGFLDLGSSVNSIPGILDTLGSDLSSGFTTLIADIDSGLGVGGFLNMGLVNIETDLTSLGTDITDGFGSGGELGQIDKDIVGIDTDLDQGFRNVLDALSTDLSPLGTISTELGNTGTLASDLTSILVELEGIYANTL